MLIMNFFIDFGLIRNFIASPKLLCIACESHVLVNILGYLSLSNLCNPILIPVNSDPESEIYGCSEIIITF